MNKSIFDKVKWNGGSTAKRFLRCFDPLPFTEAPAKKDANASFFIGGDEGDLLGFCEA